MIDVVREVASQVFIPFSVGGGLRSVEDCGRVLLAGAEKVNLNTAAVENPDLITEVSDTFGSQATVLSMDIRINNALPALTSGYEIVTHGGRKPTGIDAIKWAQRGERLGAGELVVNAMDTDGMREGYELILTRIISDSVSIPVIASGGGGHPEHLDEAFTLGGADAAIVASMLHYGDYKISEVKSYLHELGIPMRMTK
jgi:cyclase